MPSRPRPRTLLISLNALLFTAEVGAEKCGVLVALKASARNWIEMRSEIEKGRNRLMSVLKVPGLFSRLKPAIPNERR